MEKQHFVKTIVLSDIHLGSSGSKAKEATAFLKQHPAAQGLIAHCEEGNKTELKDAPTNNDTSILIGPEGDFTPSEIETALSANYLPVSLGATRLRTETAGMVAAALLIYKN